MGAAVLAACALWVAPALGLLAAPGSPANTRGADCHAGVPPVLHDGFPEPPALYSRDGALDVRLRAAVGPARMGSTRVSAWSYDGSVPGPTLVICAGDHVTVHLENELPEATNLHTHGFHVSPEGNSDNIFVHVEPHQQFTYEYAIPTDMSPGSYWYHPHIHMHVEDQIFRGMAGAIVEEGGLDRLPALRRVPQRWIVLDNTEVRHGRILGVDESTEAGDRIYVNGVLNPTAKIRPGQLQRWRIFNASADRVIVLRMAGGRPFQLLAEDGHTLERAAQRAHADDRPQLAPRRARAGRAARQLRAEGDPVRAVPRRREGLQRRAGPQPDGADPALGRRGRSAWRPPRGALSHPVDLRGQPVARERTIQFSEMVEPSGASEFLLNGMAFDPSRTDVTMKLGSVERWTLVNTTHEWHTFHMHIDDFQVVSQNGVAVPYVDYQDNVALPPGSHTVVLVKAADFTGRFVFHCHVTIHEDHGMMATIEVVREPGAAASRSSVVRRAGLAISSSAYGYPAKGRRRPAAAPALGRAPLFWCSPKAARRGRAA